MSKNFPLVLLAILMGTGMFSCKKTYTCDCYIYKRPGKGGTRPDNSYELMEKDRKTARYKCKARSSFNQYTSTVTSCDIAL